MNYHPEGRIKYIKVMDLSYMMKHLKELFLLYLIMFWLRMVQTWKPCNGVLNQIALKVVSYVNKRSELDIFTKLSINSLKSTTDNKNSLI